MNYDHKWLPHLSKKVWAGFNDNRYFDSYLIALEAWRRGLSISWHDLYSSPFSNILPDSNNSIGRLFSIGSSNNTHHFFRSRIDKTSIETIEILRNKTTTKRILAESGLMVPDGSIFSIYENEGVFVDYAMKIGFPVVVKPNNLALGVGVTANIKDLDEFKKALQKAKEEVLKRPVEKELIVEKHISGDEYRAIVVGDKVISFLKRLPANVVGNGKETIYELIKSKNNLRKLNPRLSNSLIKIDETLEQIIESAGYFLNSIPNEGEYIILKNASNFSLGGEPIDVTNDLPNDLNSIVINALKAFPGLEYAGIDLIINYTGPANFKVFIIEINGTPTISTHLFPLEGHARDVPAALIDHYFPETKDYYVSDRMQYFDLNDILKPLINKSAYKVDVMPALAGKVYAKKYIVKGKIQGVGFRQWIKKMATAKKLYGYAINLNNDDVEVVVAGGYKEVVDRFVSLCERGSEKSRVDSIEAEDYFGPVKVGFHVNIEEDKIIKLENKLVVKGVQLAENKIKLKETKEKLKETEVKLKEIKEKLKETEVKLKETKEKLKETEVKLKEIKEKLKEVKGKYKTIKNSRIWRYTSPIRKTSKLLKTLWSNKKD